MDNLENFLQPPNRQEPDLSAAEQANALPEADNAGNNRLAAVHSNVPAGGNQNDVPEGEQVLPPAQQATTFVTLQDFQSFRQQINTNY